jgi:hypothetical protein
MRLPALLVLITAVLPASALAHPGGHDGSGYYRPPSRVTEPTIIPETLPEVVSALRERVGVVSTALDAGKIADLHRACVNLTDLASAVPAKTQALPTEASARAATTATHLQQKIAELYSAATAANVTAGKEAIAAITADVDVLEGFTK